MFLKFKIFDFSTIVKSEPSYIDIKVGVLVRVREKSFCFERKMKMPIFLRDLNFFGVVYRILYLLNRLLFSV